MCNNPSNQRGFTLIELLVGIAIAGLLFAAVFNTFLFQNKSNRIQEQLIGMQQNMRAGFLMMVKELRMAGYDPQETSGADIISCSSDSINFTLDDNGNGVIDGSSEDITYSFDGTDYLIMRDISGDSQVVAEHIENIEFLYTLKGAAFPTLAVANPSDVRAVQITLLARAESEDRDFNNNMTYTTASGATWGPYNDGFRRRLITTTVRCRNMGL